RLDRSRSLPVADPDQREQVIACGAALLHLRVALGAAGYGHSVQRLPDPVDRDLLARLTLTGRAVATEAGRRLFEAIPRRHTQRGEFFGMPIPDDLMARFREACLEEGARFEPIVGEGPRARLIALVMAADHLEWSDARYRDELARWTRSNNSDARDGVFGYTEGVSDTASLLRPLVLRSFNRGEREAEAHQAAMESAPLLAVLTTAGDDRDAWVRCGEALERVLLEAADEGVMASFLGGAVESGETRAELRRMLDEAGVGAHPQVVLRMGYGAAGPSSPRRGVDEVIDLDPS
ncbi:MAG: nitroreductase family protein, partial [Polyangiales bacterium]